MKSVHYPPYHSKYNPIERFWKLCAAHRGNQHECQRMS